ncbi:MAG TPA: lysine exporter LysO family protein [Candidatus Acidoferrum sp.]|nr:lysine exporter LysO family protein [Candidatus Acidoferrum sp.]
MKNSLIILACLVAGILLGVLAVVPRAVLEMGLTVYALNALLFLVGIEIGANTRVWQVARRQKTKIFLVPLSAVLGTFLGVALCSLCVPGVGFRQSLAVGSGFGYYTLASVLIAEIGGKTLGVLALLSNIMREMATLLTAPLLARYFGRLAPIVSGGATSMDTTLPIITRSVGTDFAVISVVNGVVLTLLAPLLITAILR